VSHDARHGSQGAHGGAYEERDARPAPLFRLAIGLVAISALTFLVVGWIVTALDRSRIASERRPPLAEYRERPTGPLLQANPGEDVARQMAKEETCLSTYGWVDRPAGVVRVPIWRAMQLVAERGLPARAPEEGR
jgi:hypothetical protein